MTVIGITGPTGAGKTTALRELEKLGGCVLDADAVYHELLKSDTALQGELRERFGDMTGEDGCFDRKRLGRVVFQNRTALEDLNRIAHRHVVDELRRRLARAEQEDCRAAAIDAYALFESGCDKLCDTTVAVLAPAEIRVRRIMNREGISEDYARARVAAQRDDAFYRQRCGHILMNDCVGAEEFADKARMFFQSVIKTTVK